MIQEGIVLEIHEKYAVAMLKEGRIVKIRLKEGLRVGDHIYILPEDLYEEQAKTIAFVPKSEKRKNQLRRIATLAAAIVLCVSVLLTPQLSMPAYAVASVDGQQSVQLELDKHGRVIRATSPDNSIEKEALDGYKGRELEQIAQEIKKSSDTMPYIVGYAKKNQDTDETVEKQLREIFGEDKLVYFDGDWDDIEKANERELSLGLYIAGEQITSATHEQLDDLDDLTLEQLYGMLRQDPAWMQVPEFADAVEDVLEDAAESDDFDLDDDIDESDDTDFDDPDDADDFDSDDEPDDADFDDPDDADDTEED